MRVIDIEQGSEAWIQARVGRVTASRLADLTSRTKTGFGASRANYLAELLTERLTGVPAERFQNDAMRWGIEKENEARDAYAFRQEVTVEQVGFVIHPRIEMSGASPDGLVGMDGLVEIKCPSTATHIETLRGGSVPGKYITQMHWQMACTGRAWCDFASYDPRMPAEMRLFVKRVPRDEALIAELEEEVASFLAELALMVADLRGRYSLTVAA